MISPEYVFVLLCIAMPLVAFLYASVGHGGASSYLMLLTLLNFAPDQIRPTALILNIFVSLIAFLSYRKACVFPQKLFMALVIFSIPAAFLGGTIQMDTVLYKKLLGFLLLFPVLRFLNVFPVANKIKIERQWWMAPLLGISIGLVSGMIGIGGGIILSPIILMLGWAAMKETAALSALFIFVNSIAGFLGSKAIGIQIDTELWFLMPLTIAGGALGAYYGAHKFNVKIIKYALTLVLFIASVKLIWT